MKIHPPLVCAALLLLGQALHALPLQVLAWDDAVAGRKLTIAHAKGVNELKNLHPLDRSEVFDVVAAGDGPPPRLQALDRLDEKGAPAEDPLRIPAGVKRPLVLLFEDAKAATGIRMVVLEDDRAGFGWGTIRVVNATGRQLLFKCEGKVSGLPANWTPVDIRPGGQRRNMEVVMALRDQPDQLLYSAVWEFRDTFRQLVFIAPGTDSDDGPVSFKFINEVRLQAEGAAAGG